jgi:hypothetical protein
MMQHNNQPDSVEYADLPIGAASGTALSPDYNSARTGAIVSAALIFGAWIAGTLLFEISALDNAGSRSASEHWGSRTTIVDTWKARETEFAALRGFDGVAEPLANLSRSEVNSKVAATRSNPSVVNAGSVTGRSTESAKVRLSSHQSDVRQRGLRLPRMNFPSMQAISAQPGASKRK